MRHLKELVPAILILALLACAKPPQAEIDAAKAAVAKAAQDADIVTYAADSLKKAQNLLAQMQTELDAKRYDKVKTLSVEATAAAEKAKADAQTNKEQVKAEASALIDAVKKALPEAEKTIASAKKVRGIKLDFTALTKEMTDTKTAIADAEKNFANGDFMAAKNKAAAVQVKLADGAKMISDAVRAATKKK